MTDRKRVDLPPRRMVVEVDIRVPDSHHSPRRRSSQNFQKAVADAVRRELQRTRRI